jgi:hypothetical protein
MSANHILKSAAKAAILFLDKIWFKYVDDKLQVIIQYFLFGTNAKVNNEIVDESQEWLFKWSLLYFKHMKIKFYK